MDYGTIMGAVMQILVAFESLTGMPIIVAERNAQSDELAFREDTLSKVCPKANGFNFCDTHMTNLPSQELHTGWSVVMQSENEQGEMGSVCVILPPERNLNIYSSVYAVSSFYGYSAPNFTDRVESLPTQAEAEATLMLIHIANCMGNNSIDEQLLTERSIAFTALSMTLIQGDPVFTRYPTQTPARKYAYLIDSNITHQAVNIGERILFEMWKQEAAAELQQKECPRAAAVPSGELNTRSITRTMDFLPACYTDNESDSGSVTRRYNNVSVTDSNLHLWMYGVPQEVLNRYRGDDGYSGPTGPTTGAPPSNWTPMKNFSGDYNRAVRYIWNTANELTGL